MRRYHFCKSMTVEELFWMRMGRSVRAIRHPKARKAIMAKQPRTAAKASEQYNDIAQAV